MRLNEGDKLAAQGSLKLEIYNGKISRTVFVDAILPLRAPPREKKAKAEKPAPTPTQDQSTTTDATPKKETAAGGPAFFSDDIPFEAAR